MPGDIARIGALDHLDRRVMQRPYDSDGYVGKQLPHNGTVPQRVERDFVWIESGCLDHHTEIIAMMTAAAVSPALAVGAQEQRRIWRAALYLLLEHRRQSGRDRHGAALVPFVARPALGRQRHEQARLRPVGLQISDLKPR